MQLIIQAVMLTEKKKIGKKKLLTSSVLTISFAMKRRIFNGTDGFPNLLCRNFIQRGRSTGTVPWNLKKMSKKSIQLLNKTSLPHQKNPSPQHIGIDMKITEWRNSISHSFIVLTREMMPNFWFILASSTLGVIWFLCICLIRVVIGAMHSCWLSSSISSSNSSFKTMYSDISWEKKNYCD